jgi:hypothetical protein
VEYRQNILISSLLCENSCYSATIYPLPNRK